MSGNRSTMIDWDLATLAASKMSGAGPVISREEAEAVVAELREGARRSTPLVREFTGLAAPEGTERTAPVLVVDRAGWIKANVDGFATIISPLVDRLQAKRGTPSPVAQAVGSRVTGLELGALLGFMSSKVLGQFDPFHAPAGSDVAGRLLLVAPNIVHVENELDVDPTDFRLWVCLHEETHRVQFTAVPWMRDHLFSEITALTDSVEPTRLTEDAVRRISEAVRGGGAGGGGSLMDVMSTPEQREILDRVTGVMSLLEGHADVVMDGVGPTVIPSVDEIRKLFNERRKGIGTLDRILRRLLGLDAKMAQYRDGAKFVNHVVNKVGMEQFNAVWAGPENLPSKSEIGDPQAWITRVL
jgi:coenzyme F420 biosynthesis associated uncharacterized protein